MKTSLNKIFLLIMFFSLFTATKSISQKAEKITWFTDEEMAKVSMQDMSKKLEGKWLYIYRSCPWEDQETTKNEERVIEFKEDSTAFQWYKNNKTDAAFFWKIKEESKGWFTLDYKIEETDELVSPFDLKGRIMISKDYKYISFSNEIEIDAGCLVCFKRVEE
jgi:hypothetical protein